MNPRTIFSKYAQDTRDFLADIKSSNNDAQALSRGVMNDREQIINDRADLIKKQNALLNQANSMISDRRDLDAKHTEALKLRDEALGLTQKATEQNDLVELRLSDVKRREGDLVGYDDKMAELAEIEKVRMELDVEKKMVRREQDLLHEKQRTLEVREGKIADGEARLKRLHADI